MTKNWFIIGVSTGLGRSLAEVVLRQGDKVAATFRQQEQAAEFTQRHQPNGLGLVANVADETQVKAAVATAAQTL